MLNVLLLILVVVLEMACDVVLKVLLLTLFVAVEIDCDVVLEALQLPLDSAEDTTQHAAAEHFEWSPQLTHLNTLRVA